MPKESRISGSMKLRLWENQWNSPCPVVKLANINDPLCRILGVSTMGDLSVETSDNGSSPRLGLDDYGLGMDSLQ